MRFSKNAPLFIAIAASVSAITMEPATASAQEQCRATHTLTYMHDCNPDTCNDPRIIESYRRNAVFNFILGDDKTDYYWVRAVGFPYFQGFVWNRNLNCDFDNERKRKR